MAMTPCAVATNNIATVGTNVAERAMTTDQFKALFDKYGADFVAWFNATHLAEVNTHLAETVSIVVATTRDISLTGVQTIALPFKARSIRMIGGIGNTNMEFNSVWSENSGSLGMCVGTYDITTGVKNVASHGIFVGTSTANYAYADIQNVTSAGFELNWTKTGAPTGTLTIFVQAETH